MSDYSDDDGEPIPGFDCSPLGMSPVLMLHRLRNQKRPFTDSDREEAAKLIERLVAQLEEQDRLLSDLR